MFQKLEVGHQPQMATVPSSDVIDPDMAGYLLVAATWTTVVELLDYEHGSQGKDK